MYPLVADLAADGIPVALTCRMLGFSKQASYAWPADPVTGRDLEDAYLTNAALDIHTDDWRSGTVSCDKLAIQGIAAGANRVARLFSQQRIWSVFAKKRGRNRMAGPPVSNASASTGGSASTTPRGSRPVRNSRQRPGQA